jgi:hypothetical protein
MSMWAIFKVGDPMGFVTELNKQGITEITYAYMPYMGEQRTMSFADPKTLKFTREDAEKLIAQSYASSLCKSKYGIIDENGNKHIINGINKF